MKSHRTRTCVSFAIAAAVGALSIGTANAAGPESKPADAVQVQYVVVRGDTLWSISARFLNEPRRWQEIWHLNQTRIEDPNLIYPGHVIVIGHDAQNVSKAVRHDSRIAVPGTQVRSSNPQVTPDCLHILKHNYLVPLNCDSPGLREWYFGNITR
jgi:LysM repeat protein